jgi:DNA-binding response OmpR family regulator
MGRILLVEDDVDILFLLEHIVRAAGHNVDGASTRERAGELIYGRGSAMLFRQQRKAQLPWAIPIRFPLRH